MTERSESQVVRPVAFSHGINKGSRDGSREIAARETLAQTAAYWYFVPMRALVSIWMQEAACTSAAPMMSRYVVALYISWHK